MARCSASSRITIQGPRSSRPWSLTLTLRSWWVPGGPHPAWREVEMVERKVYRVASRVVWRRSSLKT